MKLLKKDFKGSTKIKVETLDDLWNLKQIIGMNDIISARTLRTIQVDKREKKPVFLKLRAEKINFDESGRRLRITGKIVAGPDDIDFGYHTISLEPGKVFSIEKEWKEYQIRKLKDSLTYMGLKLLICVLDDREADFAVVRETSVRMLGRVINKKTGKMLGGESQEEYYQKIIGFLREKKDINKIIIAGPGFTKESVFERIRKDRDLIKKCILEYSSVTGKTGVTEVIKRGVIERIVSKSRISLETALVEKFLEGLGKDAGLVVYGLKETEKAIRMGAVYKLLISDKLIRKKEIESLINLAERNRGEVHIINSSHEAGERLFHLGGIAGFLRFRIE